MSTTIVYHRGGGKSLGYSPNSTTTFEWTISVGAEAVEYDVFYCQDQTEEFMIVAESALLKENGLDLANLTWEDVSKLDAGNEAFGQSSVAKLKDVYAMFQNVGIEQQVHVKGTHEQTIPTLVQELKTFARRPDPTAPPAHGKDLYKGILITSFDLKILDQLVTENYLMPVGWIVKSDSTSSDEGGKDLTKKVSENPDSLPPYDEQELNTIVKQAKDHGISTILLCGPRIRDKALIKPFQEAGKKIGAWGVGSNIEVAKRLIEFGLDRFTIDCPEELG